MIIYYQSNDNDGRVETNTRTDSSDIYHIEGKID